MNEEKTTIRAFKNGMTISDIVTINVIKQYPDGSHTAFNGSKTCYEEMNSFQLTPTAFILEPTQAQQLMDDLWTCGIRPTEGKGSAGCLAATENHLKDMRAIAFFQTGLDKSNFV